MLNLPHLKYAVVVAEMGSVTKAAKRLHNSQPNLSRAIRELEGDLGVTIFRRTSHGLIPTPDGETFLEYARAILEQIEGIETIYKMKGGHKGDDTRPFSISVPRAGYIACAFTDFVRKQSADTDAMEFFYNETSPRHVIDNILEAGYKLGILRLRSGAYDNYKDLLANKNLVSELNFEFKYMLLLSKEHPLATKPVIHLAVTAPYLEISHADPFVPSMLLSTGRRNEHAEGVRKHVYVFERGSQMDILSESKEAFMWVSPVPQKVLDRYGLVQRECADGQTEYRDMLVRRRNHVFTDVEKAFLDELMKYKREISGRRTGHPPRL